MMNAIALDDEPPALLVLENFCTQTPSIRLEKTFTRPQEALRYLRQFPVDLLFLDIQMPSLSGIDFYKAVEQKTRVIFTTAYSEYAVEGFNLSATDYLLKPFTYERFLQAVRKAQEHFEYSRKTARDAQTWFYVRASYSLVRIAVDDILYLESIDDYLKIHLEQQAPLLARMTLKMALSKLPAQEFVQVHRSFVVPLRRVEQLRNRAITVAGEPIPVSDTYYEAFVKRYKG